MTRDEELDRILMSGEEEILPSSGFTRSVMQAVQNEASTPEPIPFPWVRALPALAAGAVALVWAVVVGFTQLGSPTAASPPIGVLPPTLIPILEAAAWSVLALLLAYASVTISMRLLRA